MIISKDTLKKYIQEQDKSMKISKDLYNAVDDSVKVILKKSISRAKENQRTTILPRDL